MAEDNRTLEENLAWVRERRVNTLAEKPVIKEQWLGKWHEGYVVCRLIEVVEQLAAELEETQAKLDRHLRPGNHQHTSGQLR